MFSYTAYGVGINSYLPLPELLNHQTQTEVVICQGSVSHPPNAQKSEQCIWATTAEAVFFWDDVGTIGLKNGQEIIVDAIRDINLDVLRLFLLGSALGTLLHQRGRLVLHASVVAINGQAIAFLGESGWGKSTTVAAFCQKGHQMVADDVLVIDFDHRGCPIVFPGYPQVKLWSETVTALGGNPNHLPKVRPDLEKYAQPLQNGFSLNPLPLKQIYILGEGKALEIHPLDQQTAFKELVFHSYAVPFLGQAFSNPTHFHQCTRLINTVPIARLNRQYSLQALPAIIELIEKDFI